MRILVAEDDRLVAGFVTKGLREASYSVDLAVDGEEALHLASTESYDAIVMDVMLPRMNGFQVVRQLRVKGCQIPVIYLTAKDRVENIVEGLEAGGDDYLSKPFSFVELLARIRALVRRNFTEAPGHIIAEADMKLDLLSRQVWRGDQKLDLTNKEFELLEYLMRNVDQVVSRTMIADHVWDLRFDFDSNLIEVHLTRLRKKMEKGGKSRLIKTLKGVGYVFRAE